MIAGTVDSYTPAELAQRLRVTERRLRYWRKEGQGPAWFRVGGSVRYRVEDVHAWIRANMARPAGGDAA